MSQNGNGNRFEEEVQLVQTTDEEGNIHLFERIDELEVDGKDYALLIYRGQHDGNASLPVEIEVDPEEDEEVIIMRLSKDDDGADIFENIDDEAEFERVAAYIESLQDEEEDDEDDEDADEDEEEFDAVKLGQLLQQLDGDDEDAHKN